MNNCICGAKPEMIVVLEAGGRWFWNYYKCASCGITGSFEIDEIHAADSWNELMMDMTIKKQEEEIERLKAENDRLTAELAAVREQAAKEEGGKQWVKRRR